MLGEALPKPLMPEGDKHFSYADYCSWDDDKRWELIDGVAYAMSAPSRMHQDTHTISPVCFACP